MVVYCSLTHMYEWIVTKTSLCTCLCHWRKDILVSVYAKDLSLETLLGGVRSFRIITHFHCRYIYDMQFMNEYGDV